MKISKAINILKMMNPNDEVYLDFPNAHEDFIAAIAPRKDTGGAAVEFCESETWHGYESRGERSTDKYVRWPG